MKTQNKERLFLLCFLVIPVLLLILFSYYPLIKLFQLSVSEWNGMSSTVRYIGLQNFKEIFSQKELFSVFINNGAYIIVALIQQFVGLFLAILLDSNLKVKKSFRAIIFMPYIINAVAIAFIFNYMYDFTNSPINVLLTNLGLKDYLVRFLGTNYSSNFWLAFISFWRYVGYTMVVYLAALQSVPREIFEAARVDGANFYQIIRKITLPNIKTMFQISLIMSINGALQAYFEPFLLTKGGPNGRTDTFITKTLSLAFDFNKFGKAAAMGVILLLIILIIVKIQKTIFKEKQDLS
jgi:multiple sugar transport system permease protein